jgi:hypothetical protein
MLKRGLRSGNVKEQQGLSEKPLILMISLLLLAGCALLSRNVENEQIQAEPVVQIINNQEYWCLEKKAFTAVLQEASRDCE